MLKGGISILMKVIYSVSIQIVKAIRNAVLRLIYFRLCENESSIDAGEGSKLVHRRI